MRLLPSIFPGQQPDEKIVKIYHRHWFVFFTQIIVVIIAAAVPVIVWYVLLPALNWEPDPATMSYMLILMLGGWYYLLLWILAYGFWLDYTLDYFIVSDKRLVDIEQAGLFHRTIAEQRLYRVQDVTSDVKGVFPTLLHYGNVYIQTAGEQERFIFEQVPNPDEVVKLILSLVDKIDDHLEKGEVTIRQNDRSATVKK